MLLGRIREKIKDGQIIVKFGLILAVLRRFTLPTEAEWEYAARQKGQKVRFGNGKDVADPAVINFDGSEYKEDYSIIFDYRRKTVPVGSLNNPNSLGLHDMSGNVYEWCWDRYEGNCNANSPQNNPKGGEIFFYRILRSAAWNGSPASMRCAFRYSNYVRTALLGRSPRFLTHPKSFPE